MATYKVTNEQIERGLGAFKAYLREYSYGRPQARGIMLCRAIERGDYDQAEDAFHRMETMDRDEFIKCMSTDLWNISMLKWLEETLNIMMNLELKGTTYKRRK